MNLLKAERLPAELYDANGTRRLDALAIKAGAGDTLMERAGHAAWHVLRANWPETKTLDVYCGAGNNAGDGYVVARLAHQRGLDVRVLCLVEPGRLSGEAKRACELAVEAEVPMSLFPDSDSRHADMLVDALLGTGLSRDVDGDYAQAILQINESPAPVLSLDVPSGIDADTGQVRGVAVEADKTLSFIGLNQGLFTGPALDHGGQILFDELVPGAGTHTEAPPTARLMRRADAAATFKSQAERRPDSHKGAHGRAVVVGGASGMGGAIQICAEGAARCGAGLVTAVTTAEHASDLVLARPEVMSVVAEEFDLNWVDGGFDAIAIGPGLGRDSWGQRLWDSALASDLPLVVDADALRLWAREPSRRSRACVTPHPGEAADLLGVTTRQIQADRVGAAQELARRYDVVCVLKGAGTVVADGKGKPAICPYGNPAMASGGMGDLLTGVIVGLVAQGLSLASAAWTGVMIHSLAGDAAAEHAHHVLATDVARHVPALINALGR